MNIGKLPALSLSKRPVLGQPPGREEDQKPPEATSRGLVPLPGGVPGDAYRGPRPSPAFLAQLIATAQHAPQTRARSRIAPADAIARYAHAASASTPSSARGRSV